MKIAFLLHHAHGTGGTIRTDLNLAAAAAERRHEVEIASVLRRRDRPAFDDDPRIRLVSLADLRKDADLREACLAARSQARKKAGRFGRGHSW